jgi:D-glycero-alpha-D-manno-heptose-7-phosphate kinase
MFNEKIISTRTPLRVSFVGGGTDMPYFYNNFSGATISCAINKYIYVIVKYQNNFQDKYRLNYSITENVNSLDKIKNIRIREVIRKLKITKPLYINTFSDVPANTGLGSSSSFTVGLVAALSKLSNMNLSKRRISEMAYSIEEKITKNAIGKQDHYIASFGGFKHIQYKKNRIKVSPINLEKKNTKYLLNSLILIWTNNYRKADKILQNLKKNKKKNYNNLKLMNKFTRNFLFEIKKKKINIKKIGEMISETWIIKKKLSRLTTNNNIDKIFDKVTNNKIIYGGKLLGAGNGGFILFITKSKKKLIKNLKKFKYLCFEIDNNGTVIL